MESNGLPVKTSGFCHYFDTGDLTKDDIYVGHVPRVKAPEKFRKPGRPRAIPQELESAVVGIYKRGYGYRAIARILREEFGVNPDFTTVRRLLKKLGLLDRPSEQTMQSSNANRHNSAKKSGKRRLS
jgi:transposase